MSDPSPFTLIRPAAPLESPATGERPRVVLPTKRKEIPQAMEPAGLTPLQREAQLRDTVARIRKAAKAPVLETSPQPPRSERTRPALSYSSSKDGDPSPAQAKPGATALPPPRKSLTPVVENAPLVDPFETNSVVTLPAEAAPTQRLTGAAPPTPVPALSPSAIRKASLATPPTQENVPLIPRQKPEHVEFNFKLASASPAETADPAPASKPKVTLPQPKNAALQSSFHDIQGWLESDGVALKIHTPNSGAPIESAEMKAPEVALVSRSRLQFNCPACHHTVSLPKKLAGRKARCPQCAAAIRAPHPKFGRGSFTYENHVEAILHPETFLTASPKYTRWLGLPIPPAQTWLVGGAAAILILGGAWMMKYRSQSPASLIVETDPASVQVVSTLEPYLNKDDGFATKTAAEKLVTDFLAADGWEQKAAFVRDSERVAPLMKDYYERTQGGAPVKADKLHVSAPAYYLGEQLKQRRSTVVAELADSENPRFVVEFLPEGALIEWESSVAYSSTTWEDVIHSPADPKSPPSMLRVVACIDRYYNNEFSNDREFMSVYLQDSISGEPLGNGYIARASEDGVRLRKWLAGSTKNSPAQIMIEVRPVENSAQERIVAITKFIKCGFRHPVSETFASVQ